MMLSPDTTDHKGFSEETCVRCGWRMGQPPLNCQNDDTPHRFPSQSHDTTDTQTLARYAESSLEWTHGMKTEDELLQRIWNLAGDVKRLVAAVAALQHERDEWKETARFTETIHNAGCDCGDDESCAWLRRAEAAEERVRVLKARQAPLERIRVAATHYLNGTDPDGYVNLHAALRVLDADTPETAAPETPATPTLSGGVLEGNDGESGAAVPLVDADTPEEDAWASA